MKSGKGELKKLLTEYQEVELNKIDEPNGRVRLDIDSRRNTKSLQTILKRSVKSSR